MAKFKLDFNLEAWIRGLEIEAENKEEAINELYKMSIEDIIDEGYVSNFNSTDIDVEVVSKNYEVEVTIEKWDDFYLDKEDEVEVTKFDSLPKTVKLTLEDVPESQLLDEAIEDELEYDYDFSPAKYTFKILREF